MTDGASGFEVTPTQLRNRIEGFIHELADHGLEVSALHRGADGKTEYGVYSMTMGERNLVTTVTGADGLEHQVRQWERRDGWPISDTDTDGKGSVASTGSESGGSQVKATKDKEIFPEWAEQFAANGRVVFTGSGNHTSFPNGSLQMAMRQVFDNLATSRERITVESVTKRLLGLWPNATVNYKSVSAGFSPFRASGELEKIRKGLYRWTGQRTTPRLSAPRNMTKNPRKSTGATKTTTTTSDTALADLLALGTDWRVVGRGANGELVYTVGTGGELYRVKVKLERL